VYDNNIAVGAGPEPVTAHDGHDGRPGDVTPLGIVNLDGGVVEWTLDGGAAYTDACWRGASLRSPRCFDENAPHRTLRGGSWFETPTSVVDRGLIPGAVGPGANVYGAFAQIGFRCAYAERPAQ